ncbi:MAG: GNAT family N-acetyltransferase [Gemmatimonadota bacterium]|nr:GNAT family N-acetyltransferase [Gemmatimonadota bacterium]
MAEQLTYRIMQTGDLPGVLRLWRDEAGWGDLTPEVWKTWFEDGPCGPSILAVAVTDGGDIVGQIALNPAELAVGDRTVRAVRIAAPIIERRHRIDTPVIGKHPATLMYLTAVAEAQRRGFSVAYALPERTWLAFFLGGRRLGNSLTNFGTAEYACMSYPLAGLESRAPLTKFRAHQMEDFGTEHEALWRDAREELPIICSIVPSRDWKNYRSSAHLTLDVRDAQARLRGYAVVRRKSGLLHDLLACSANDLGEVLGATVDWLEEKQRDTSGETLSFQALNVMASPALRGPLERLAFQPTDFRFAFACVPIDESVAPAEIAPDRWFVMPGN